MKSRLVTVAALATVALLTSGCLPQPEPEPSPAFASEAEAFAAAEETYRAYVDALNQVDLSDPETFEEVYAWTTGEANANERESLSQMHADGWRVEGATQVDGFTGSSFNTQPLSVIAVVCSNVAGVEVLDSSGNSVVSPDRRDVYTLEVHFTDSPATPTGLAVSSSNAIEDRACTN